MDKSQQHRLIQEMIQVLILPYQFLIIQRANIVDDALIIKYFILRLKKYKGLVKKLH
ncbi:hypothetical protein MYP_4942 [Sporocytophaga myxococcoides]|uniref:Uncharacterized protein n=1 Tax=Sporocytophaga myxococcoides TaxID=153721 RepID=A0A098LL26_9BACT|nr:hypothetical protein MYP_4942 [Sporocytophaga myxococcoides]